MNKQLIHHPPFQCNIICHVVQVACKCAYVLVSWIVGFVRRVRPFVHVCVRAMLVVAVNIFPW